MSDSSYQSMMLEAREKLYRANQMIDDIAWHVSDYAGANWSGPDILAHVADYYGCTVKELLRRMEQAARGGSRAGQA